MEVHIGVGDAFTYQREHWMIIDIKGNDIVCKNKDNGVVVVFSRDTVKKLIK